MKTLLRSISLAVLMIFSVSLFAQDTIPNWSFESWTDIGNSMENPEYWDSSNEYFEVGQPPFVYDFTFNTVTRDITTPFESATSVKIETVSQFVITSDVVLPGLITIGAFTVDFATQTGGVSGGIPFTTRPTSLRGYYKYTPQAADSCFIGIGLSGSGTTDTIGQGYFASSTMSSWTQFEVPIEYSTAGDPDSMNIVIMSSDPNAFVAGSILYVDSLSLVYDPVSVAGLNIPAEKLLYPNPANDYVNVWLVAGEDTRITIYNSIGCKVMSQNYSSQSDKAVRIDVSNLPDGIYLIEANCNNKKSVKKLIIN